MFNVRLCQGNTGEKVFELWVEVLEDKQVLQFLMILRW